MPTKSILKPKPKPKIKNKFRISLDQYITRKNFTDIEENRIKKYNEEKKNFPFPINISNVQRNLVF